MKKRLLTSISITLAAICFLGACSKKEDEKVEMVQNTTDLDYKPADTEYVLTQAGKSDYKIVINETDNSRGDLTFAATEVQTFIKEATGATLPIIYDTGLTFNEKNKYIVLGENEASKNCGMSLTYEEYGEDGSYIKTIGSSVYINSLFYPGAMYGAYEFLWYNFGVRIYGADEIKISDHTQDTVYLKDFDYKNIPDFPERSNGINERYDDKTAYRLGYNISHGENWYRWCHTHFNILPPATYKAEHPEYYSHDATQLCLTNEGMIQQLTTNMKAIISNSDFRHSMPGFFELGHEDSDSFCQCDSCVKAANENGGKSGVMMLFINKVADIMNPWVKETYPDITPIKWVTFAYGPTVEPPVKETADGGYEPFNDAVKPHENVGIMMAPLSCDWSHNLTDAEYNSKWTKAFAGWKSLKPEFYVYTYSVIFDDLFFFMDNWSTCKDQYKLWTELNAVYIFEEGGLANMPFYELKNYVRSKMMWDVDSDVEYYINDFIDNYYKAAAPYVREYFNRLRTNYKLIERDLAAKGETFRLTSFMRTGPEMKSKEYWSMDWLLSGIALYDEALKACETMPDGEEKDKAIKRVKAERASPIYILMELYKYELSSGDIRYYIDEFREACESNGITSCGQKGSVQDTISEWTACLSD